MLYRLSAAMYRYATSEKSFVECTIAGETPGCVEEMFGSFLGLQKVLFSFASISLPFFFTLLSLV